MGTTRTTTAGATLVLLLLLAGCRSTEASAPATTATTETGATTETEAATGTAPSTDLPDPGDSEDPAPGAVAAVAPAPEFLRGELPSADELDAAVADAGAAYLRHRALYDEGFRTGFADPQVVEDLLATTSGDLRELVRQGAEQFEGPPVDGSSEVVSLEAVWLHLPVAAVDYPEVTFETCLFIIGGLAPEDRGEVPLTVRMVQQDGTWVVWSQQSYGEECAG